jgi:hypothetical protein
MARRTIGEAKKQTSATTPDAVTWISSYENVCGRRRFRERFAMHHPRLAVRHEFASQKYIAYDLSLAQMAIETRRTEFARSIDDLPRATGGRKAWASHSTS